MKKIHIYFTGVSTLIVFIAALYSSSAAADGYIVEPPKVVMTDPFNVNVSTAQVMASVDTLSIGGEMGLSHSISGHTNNFSFTGWRGHFDSFEGAAKKRSLGERVYVDGDYYDATFYVMRVYGPEGTEDFKFIVNGEVTHYPRDSDTNYSYEALGDTRNKLEESQGGTHLDWTTPNGTIYRYRRHSQTIASQAELVEIIYSTGFTIYRSGYSRVSTNTGYEIKYLVVEDNRSPSPGLCSSYVDGVTAECDSDLWAARNPSRFVGINNATEVCSTTGCSNLEHDWPTASIEWPAGMPKAIYVGENDVVVTNAAGGKTTLHFSAQDLRAADPYDVNPDLDIYVHESNKVSPRLVGITPAGASERVYEYEYRNSYYWENIDSGAIYSRKRSDSPHGIIKKAKGPAGNAGYSVNTQSSPAAHERKNQSSWEGGFIEIASRAAPYAPGSLIWATITGKGRYTYPSYMEGTNKNYRNFPTKFTPSEAAGPGPKESYDYNDSTQNLEVITYNDSTTASAVYGTTCSLSTRKYCNKPTSVTDQNGNTTIYKYHHQSGQIASIKKPADDYGRHPIITYEYDQYSAIYMDPVSGVTVTGSPIWLKSAEKFCRTQAANSSGNCPSSSDQVVTTYDYGPQDGTFNNLHLRGVTVTAEGETRRTCYEYDIYGNQIGETRPKANKQSCY